MSIFSGLVIYVLTWWMVMFCLLPLNIQSITKTTGGLMPGAPENHGLKNKVLATTVVAGLVWLVIFLIIKSDLISFRDIAQHMRR
jgi:predicted secreted protein